MTFISSSTIIFSPTAFMIVTIITNNYIRTKSWTIIRITINNITTFFSFPISSWRNSMRIFKCEYKCFIVMFYYIYLIIPIKILYTLSTPRLSCVSSKDPSFTTLYHYQCWSFIITTFMEGFSCISMF